MSIGVTVTKNFNLAKINLDLSKELNMAADIIVKDIESGIEHGRDINGTSFKKLKPSTIHSKRDRGSSTPRIALSDKGVMKKVYVPSGKRATKTKQRVEIIPPKKRADIGAYHQLGTKPHKIRVKKAKVLFPLFDSRGNKFGAKEVNHPGVPKREWFGISKTAESRVMKMTELRIEKEIRDA